MTEVATPMTLEQMTAVRTAALSAAVALTPGAEPAQVAHNAGVFLFFMLNGVPVGTTGVVTAPQQNAGTESPKKAATPRKATTLAAVPAAGSTVAAGASAVTAVTETVAPPVTLAEAADALRALVNTQGDPKRNRDIAVQLIKSYGVEKMAEIPAPKLADFVRRAKSADPMNLGAASTGGDDVLAGL